MAKDKQSFVLYCDVSHTVKLLDDETAGKLFKHILAYVNDENPADSNPIVQIAFEPIKQSLKRDLKKYETRVQRNKVNGAKGGRPKKTQKTQSVISKPKKADSDSDSDSVIDSDIKIIKHTGAESFLLWFNQMKEKHFGQKGKFRSLSKPSMNNLKQLKKDNYSASDFNIAIRNCAESKWVLDNHKFTPDHFLRLDNFTKYLNQGGSKKVDKKLNTFD